ncbi:hypothetical protein LEP1GSC043_1348 [Leptospira weilii str. Ecochallenge]|uniref:Uncharacterized protein n=1 Tax=Leptospira weilii str. Ecochallenge TaxID=1049986 RepID=N1UCD5_9LEPT|nr:hypothetical protein LEP1GSC043_1348 [Leptospira weilii str. Ecochallenge]
MILNMVLWKYDLKSAFGHKVKMEPFVTSRPKVWGVNGFGFHLTYISPG